MIALESTSGKEGHRIQGATRVPRHALDLRAPGSRVSLSLSLSGLRARPIGKLVAGSPLGCRAPVFWHGIARPPCLHVASHASCVQQHLRRACQRRKWPLISPASLAALCGHRRLWTLVPCVGGGGGSRRYPGSGYTQETFSFIVVHHTTCELLEA